MIENALHFPAGCFPKGRIRADDLIVEILEGQFDGVRGRRRIHRIIKCIIWGIQGGVLTVLCIYVGGMVSWLLAVLILLMTIVAICKTYRGR